MTPAGPHRYLLHGLTVESTLRFPELLPATEGEPEVAVETGDVPATLGDGARTGGSYQVEPERLLIWMPREARFLVSNRRQLRVQPDPGGDLVEIRRLLLSSPWGALLRQRGLMALHASAVAVDGAGVLFLGGPSAGKSTLAAQFLGRGFRVLSDDLAALHFAGDGQTWIMPGWAELRLWPDSLVALGRDRALLPRIHAESRKRALRFPDRFDSAPVPLRAIYLLETVREARDALTPLTGLARASALLHHTYHAELIEGPEAHKTHYFQIGRLATAVRFRCLSRPEGRFYDRTAVDRIVEDCRR